MHELIDQLKPVNILCVGDIYLDEYVFGQVTRISEEAPVPVFVHKESKYTPGAMGNVAANCKALGANVSMIGVLGNDPASTIVDMEMRERKIDTSGIVTDKSRPTTHKAKYLAGGDTRTYQHVFRADKESRIPVDEKIEGSLLDSLFLSIQPGPDAIILSDYGNGVITAKILKAVIELGASRGFIVTADSRGSIMDYEGVSCIMPNKHEVALNGFDTSTDLKLIKAGIALRRKLDSPYLIIKVGSEGMWFFDSNDETYPTHIAALQSEVADVTGAGDTALAMFTIALSSGLSGLNSAKLANLAAGLSVRKVGASTITLDEMKAVNERRLVAND